MQKNSGFKITYALSVAMQLGFLIIASIGGFVFLGMWLDSFFHSSPLLLIIGIGVGITITIYEAYHLLEPLIRSDNQP